MKIAIFEKLEKIKLKQFIFIFIIIYFKYFKT